jgi:hypothetical protein
MSIALQLSFFLKKLLNASILAEKQLKKAKKELKRAKMQFLAFLEKAKNR